MAVALKIEADTPAARQLITPEGVPLDLTLASLSDRATAFVIDGTIIILVLALVVAASCLGFGLLGEASWVVAAWSAAVFALLNGYFVWFELRSSGRTPGKRTMGIRVLSRSGGPLRADAVIARNLVRNVEVFIPIGALAFRHVLFPGASTATWLLACAWLLGLALVPAFNRDRLRIGDLVAGTWVVKTPRASLLRDLAKRATAAPANRARAAAPPAAGFAFTTDQLDVYGIYELQALEDVLRSQSPEASRLRKTVADKIVAKIRYAFTGPADPDRFLADFYAALRAHLERKMLFGRRKERKDR